jgi:DNA-binding beta-propeller fold protein YncE
MTITTGDKYITIPTETGPVAIKYVAPALGEKYITIPTETGPVAQKYAAPILGGKYITIPTETGPVALAVETATPTGMILFGLVVDRIQNRVYYTSEYSCYVKWSGIAGHPSQRFGGPGTGNGQFTAPQGIAIGPDGYVYVADTGNSRIQVFTTAWVYLNQFAASPPPENIAIDAAGHIFTTSYSWGNGSITEYNSAGTFIRSVKTESKFFYGIKITASGAMLCLDWSVSPQKVTTINPATLNPTTSFDHPWIDIAYSVNADSAGNIYVANTYSHNILKFSAAGTYLTKWGTAGSGSGQFQYPTDISLDAADNVYVVDAWNGRIQKFTSAGVYLTSWT